MWETLSTPWQAALEMAWEAYKCGTVPIGAVVADANGNIVARGRNRIHENNAPEGQVCANELAHAEINALLSLKLPYKDARHAALYTTMEPCPLCMGALYMSDVKTLYYAARDPWAGSANLLGTTPYLSRKPFKAFAPDNPLLETALIALHTGWQLFDRTDRVLETKFYDAFRAIHPRGVETGIELHRSGELGQMKINSHSAGEFFSALLFRVQ
jgi:tRNA(adenine34) deaminase